jgi:hypothetical protein
MVCLLKQGQRITQRQGVFHRDDEDRCTRILRIRGGSCDRANFTTATGMTSYHPTPLLKWSEWPHPSLTNNNQANVSVTKRFRRDGPRRTSRIYLSTSASCWSRRPRPGIRKGSRMYTFSAPGTLTDG